MKSLTRLTLAALTALALAPMTTATAQTVSSPLPKSRADVAPEFRWDFTPIFKDWAAWEAATKDLEAKIDAFAARKGTLKNGPAAVLAAWQGSDEMGKLMDRVYWYTALQRDVDTRDQAIAGRFQRANAVYAKYQAAAAWFTPELITVPQAQMERWIAETPALQPYRFPLLDVYRKQQHVLDEKGEHLLALSSRAGEGPREAYQELSTSDIKFPAITLSDGKSVTLSPGAYFSLLDSNRNPADRRAAAEAHLGAYGATANTYAALYNAVLQRDWFEAQARKFPTTLDAAVFGNAIPKAVVETLLDTTRKGTAPLQRYFRLRKQLLGLNEYHNYDGRLPLFKSEQRYPYAQAKELALASIAPLGEEYGKLYRQFVAGGRIDVYETPGKRSGAYQLALYGVGPYMLLNHNDTLDSVFTLAHEAGHAMHSVLSQGTQPYVTSDATIFVAEVASTTNERFLLEELLRRTIDPKERFLLLQHAADSIVSTFYTQVLFADFELQAHRLVEQGQPITTAVLNGLYRDLMKSYYGDAVVLDPWYDLTWTRISHFFNSPYYVYQYATCFASSAQLFKAMTTGSDAEKKAATARYLDLLKSGGNDHPMAQLKKAGVDLTQRATVQAVVDQLDELVARMEAEAAKIPR